MNYSAIITDIEGTTNRISFVTDVLFPYAAKHLPNFTAIRLFNNASGWVAHFTGNDIATKFPLLA